MEQHYNKTDPGPSRQQLASAEPHEGFAKKIAVLFTDMKGSSAFYKTHGNLAGRIMIQKLNDMLFPIVKTYKGRVVKTIGDSIMAYFLSPKEALWTSIAMQKRLETYNRDHPPDDHLLIRICMNYGYGIVEEKDVFGDVVNTAAKLLSCCDAQHIIVTEALYHETKDSPEITFSSFAVRGNREKVGEGILYQVNWRDTPDQQSGGQCYLLSLKMEKAADANTMPHELSTLTPIVRRGAQEMLVGDHNEMNALFPDVHACLAAARQALQTCLQSASGAEELPLVLRVGLHAVDAKSIEKPVSVHLFEKSVEVCRRAQPYEIVLTAAACNALPADLRKACVPLKRGADVHDSAYLFRWETLQQSPAVLTAITSEETSAQRPAAPCFYCGSTRHATVSCPSKYIQKPTNFLDRLGYLPLDQMRHIFHENFADIVKPLQRGTDEKRFETLFKQSKDDPFSLAFFSFYEITQVFQLRSLQPLYLRTGDGTGQPAAKTGTLIIGEDCLRVSRFDEAGNWFEKALDEQANDYRPHIALGLLAVEKSKTEDALFHFTRALSFSLPDSVKRYVRLLVARLHDVTGALQEAQREIELIAAQYPEWQEARYYLGVIYIKSTKTRQALEIFRKLIQQSPRYYLMVFLNPELNRAGQEIIAFLNKELIAVRARSITSYENIKQTLADYRGWFDEHDEDYTKARELLQKVDRTFQAENLAGLMDVPSFEHSINHLLRRALDRRQRDFRKKIADYKSMLEEHTLYLQKFPYRKLLSARDVQLNENFRRLLEQGKQISVLQSPQSLREASALLENLTRTSSQITASRRWLEVKKSGYFTLECSLRIAAVFVITVIITTLLFTAVLLLYQGYEQAFSSITAAQFKNFLKFGFYAGLCAGAAGCGVWIKARFGKLLKKMES